MQGLPEPEKHHAIEENVKKVGVEKAVGQQGPNMAIGKGGGRQGEDEIEMGLGPRLSDNSLQEIDPDDTSQQEVEGLVGIGARDGLLLSHVWPIV